MVLDKILKSNMNLFYKTNNINNYNNDNIIYNLIYKIGQNKFHKKIKLLQINRKELHHKDNNQTSIYNPINIFSEFYKKQINDYFFKNIRKNFFKNSISDSNLKNIGILFSFSKQIFINEFFLNVNIEYVREIFFYYRKFFLYVNLLI